MSGRRIILVLLGVFVAGGVLLDAAVAGSYGSSLTAYDGWIVEDYRYQIPDVEQIDTAGSEGITDPNLFSGVTEVMDFSEDGNFDPVGALFGIFKWISEIF